ncbi:intradiol ring-cleavage dioxygenase [Nonomuraea dietziae]|uniref:Protocatechuate 3,4-dioxygenase beta subunit n=1 Tax=Nonomuraea dietziae TaxID=65515 RepID=A0A7W5VJC8_9ACTN|nr:intradiol ring-cleavage dioxygenase [Nonomuraea dietziae]MBB3733063.1 protocatechuate 3,4-dioxygenase beta subunit [Nonomuraea dietziae]
MPHHDIFDRGLQFDMAALLERRKVLGLLAGAGLATLTGCGGDSTGAAPNTSSSGPPRASSSAGASASSATCAQIPEETAGPYPGDGSNGPNILTRSGVVRSDIRGSVGSASGTAEGVPLTIDLTLLDSSRGCSALAGAAVYVWQCDRDGNYSMYSESIASENYLRGVQESDGEGKLTFKSIFPACYAGRWPHIHFEVYPSLARTTSPDHKIVVSQLALPRDVCEAVYATDGYTQSVRNLSQVSLDSDGIFGDGHTSQLGTVTGSVSSGLAVSLSVAV